LRAGLASSAEVDERYVQKQLGHSSAEMTRRYQPRRDRFRLDLTKAGGCDPPRSNSDGSPHRDMLRISSYAEVSGMSQAVVGRWGKNLAIRFPADVAKAAGLGDGQRVEIVSHDNEVVIRKLPPEFTIDEMFRGKPPQAWREIYADAYDWGPDRGRERVEE
jgi:antitoxin component of MazEF toxin-antitoxin module